ncbi:MAG: galactokinase [Clostridia bacterium]|nr:galactokinase [Clostridia bacterium]
MISPNGLIEKLKSGVYNDALSLVYPGKEKENALRLCDVANDFCDIFGADEREFSIFSAPGRTEVCGNHTDHNHGQVLAAAISLDAVAVAAKRDDGIIRIKSAGYDMDEININALEPDTDEFSKSAGLIRGIAARFKQLGYKIGGFDAATASNVLKGSGMSSSAAFEVLVGTILNYLYNEGKIDAVEIAKISQYAENVYFGKPCGLMDQMACSVGGFVNIDFCDPSVPVIKKIDFDFEKCGHCLCITDTKGDHSDLTDEYAAVRGEMESVASFFGKNVLREADEKEFTENISDIRAKFGDRAVLRAMHFYAENRRVAKQVESLNRGDFEAFKATETESGFSSFMYNQNVYTCTDTKNQPVSLGLAISEKILSGCGAWRVHGGGFAGTIQAFVPADKAEEYTAAMKAVFGENCCHILKIRQAGGVKLV